MTRQDILGFERFYATTLRREAARRRKRYPGVAEQLEGWAAASDARAEAIRCGPLFAGEATVSVKVTAPIAAPTADIEIPPFLRRLADG